MVRTIAAGVGAAVVLAAVSGSLLPMPASAATVVNVSTTSDVVDGDTGSVSALINTPGAGANISLREAIEAADNTSGPVTIDVPAGTYTLTTGVGFGQLAVGTVSGSNITISGAGPGATTIAGDGTDRVLSLDPNLVGNVTVAISGVTITGGHDQDGFGGAGIIGGNPSPPDTTTLSNCVVTNNTTTSSSSTNSPGGGIQYIGGALSIDSCTISDNSSGSSPGGGVDFETLSPHIGSFSLTNSTVSGNTLTNKDASAFVGGGGVHAQAEPGSTVALTGDTFTGNTATGSSTGPVGGGGLWLEGGATVTGSTFTGNQANGPANTLAGGGAINLETGSTTLSFSRIVGNSASHGPGGVLNDGVQAVTTATDNWWGCNTGPSTTGCDAATNSGGGTGSLTTGPWLKLTATAVPTKLLAGLGHTSTVTASLTHDSNNADTSGSGHHVPDGIAVGYSSTLGGVAPTNNTLSSGTATMTYTAGVTTGNGGATATVDHQSVTAAIGVGIAPTITSADNATFTATLANTFTVTATGTPAPTFSEAGTLPGTVSLNSAGVLSGTFPQIAGSTTYPITITASNGYGIDATQSFTRRRSPAPTTSPSPRGSRAPRSR
ncbi:MAG: hypothetical protein E6I76_04655 [Chloroflexi bacterium]|nr:MAG: hypothetical protein E6I76_04655 [Chloroflexota bacterium]